MGRSHSAERVTSTSASPTKGTKGRICDEPGCGTHLSIYNEFDFCAQHQPMVFPRLRGVILDR
jgi:hypothetical protein